jgi:hypothetical protein
MAKWHATCETCRSSVFDPAKVVAFRLRWVTNDNRYYLESVDLEGREPWCGIRVICIPCLVFFRRETESERKKAD